MRHLRPARAVGIVTRVALPVLVAAGPTAAQTAEPDTLVLTLVSARQMALRASPSLAASAQDTALARGELRSARQLPNPELEIEAPGASSSSLGAYQAILGQEVEWAGQRGLRIGSAQRGADRALWDVRNAERELIRDVSLTFVEAAASTRRVESADSALALARQLLTAARAQLEAGKISPLDANLAEIEYGRARAHSLSAVRDLVSAETALKTTIGLDPGRAIRVTVPDDTGAVAPLPPVDSLVAIALARRPDLAARSAAVDEASSRLRLARREAIPNLLVGPMAERDESSGAPRVGLALGVGLPVWNRNGGEVAQQGAEALRASHELSATELSVRAEVREARRAVLSTQEEVDDFRTLVLEPARENRQLVAVAYAAGKLDLPSLLLIVNQLLDAETEYWDAWLAHEEALIRLQAATGGPGAPGGRDAGQP